MAYTSTEPVKNNSRSFDDHYNSFAANSTIGPTTCEYLEANIPSILSDILGKRDAMKNFAILGVGCFNGDPDMIIMKHVKKSLKPETPFQYTAVEPCIPALHEFKTAAVKLFEDNPSFIFDKNAVLFSTFIEKNEHQPNSYDFIHFIRCINYAHENDLTHCYNKELKDGGKILVLVETDKSPLKKICDQFQDKQVPCDFDPYYFNTLEDVKQKMDKNGWKYELKPPFGFEIDVTECFTGSDVGDSILESLIKGDVRQHATSELREEIKKTLLELSSEVNGRRIMYEESQAIVITKVC